MSGISVGASGETADDMRTSGFEAKEALLITSIVRVGEGVQCVPRASAPRKRGPITSVVQYLRRQLAACPNAKARRMGPRFRGDDAVLLLRLGLGGFCGLGLGGLGLGVRLGRSLFGLVHALDLGGLAQLGDIIRLRLARHIGLDLRLDLLEFWRLAVAPFLDLDDLPAEL